MRFVFLLGGVLGFLVAGTVSFLADHTAGRTLFDAAIGAIAGGVLFRWFWNILVRGMRETLLRRHAAAQAAAQSSPATPTRLS